MEMSINTNDILVIEYISIKSIVNVKCKKVKGEILERQVLNMQDNFKKEDLRVLKTHRVLIAAMTKLLEHRNFSQITVNDLCEEAQISRTTFYLHFNDKYNFLSYWLSNMNELIAYKEGTYEGIEQSVNSILYRNSKIIKNVIEDANSETCELLCDIMFSRLKIDKTGNRQTNPKYTVFSVFCSGGMLSYLQWQVKNKFPEDFKLMNPYIYGVLSSLQEWNEEQD